MLAVPPRQRASAPPELRGLRRDGVRLCVVERAARAVVHTTVARLGDHLGAGDLLVVNSSRTIPATLRGARADGGAVEIRPWVRRGQSWDALAVGVTPPHAPVPLREGERLRLPGGLTALVTGRRADVPLVWRLELEGAGGLETLLAHGRPIRYSYAGEGIAAEHDQTVYATHPGSAETPSAGRVLSWELLLGLRARGVEVADIVLHTGLSSTQDDAVDATHPLLEEWFSVGPGAAAAINRAGRVVAVGTTVVRALESAAGGRQRVLPARGWTGLAVTPGHRMRAVDSLLTGLHEPGASHLDIVAAAVPAPLLERAHAEMLQRGYLWHEFGDSMLVL
jgi:S-adenosylmethionine:tRNA ribosyltransferase-isomerase